MVNKVTWIFIFSSLIFITGIKELRTGKSMKKLMSVLITMQIALMNCAAMQAAEINNNTESNESSPTKICCVVSEGGMTGGVITAITIGGAGGAFALALAAKKLAEKNMFSTINRFDVSSVYNPSEVQDFMPQYEAKYKLLPAAFKTVTSKAVNSQNTNANLVPIGLEAKSTAISDESKIIVLSDSSIQNKTLHAYSVQLPEGTVTNGKSVLVDAKFVFDSPSSVTLNKNTKNIDIRLFKNIALNKIAKTISNKKYSYQQEYKGIVKVNNMTPCTDDSEKNIYTVEKEFKLNSADAQKPFLITVSSLKKLKKSDKDYADNYAVVLKVKNAD